MNRPLKSLAAAAVLIGLVSTSHAVPVVGAISYAGHLTVNTGNLNTATAITSPSFGGVTSRNGFFNIVPQNDPLILTPFQFAPFVAPASTLVSIASIPTTQFFLTTLTVEQPGDDTLTLRGFGFYRNGPDETPGSWLFTANQAGGTISWSASSAAPASPGGWVPDGGMTAAMLGMALLSLCAMTRRIGRI